MGMDSVYRLSVVLGLVDNMSNGLSNVTNNVTASTKSINEAFGTVQKAGAALTGVGAGILGAGIATVKSTFETQDALGELSSLGVTDLKAVENAAKSFSDTWAGTTKSDFITAAYDIKSGIASLTDEGVAQFTELAALTGKATKSTTEEMGSLFATGYGIYKGAYEDMSDMDFGEMFSAGISTAVKNYKTAGSEMASAISVLGATATNNKISMEEQLAILGQLQTTMSGSEAATKYKAFLNAAASAGDKLKLSFVDTNNQLLSTPEILSQLQSKYGDTLDAVEKQQIKEAVIAHIKRHQLSLQQTAPIFQASDGYYHRYYTSYKELTAKADICQGVIGSVFIRHEPGTVPLYLSSNGKNHRLTLEPAPNGDGTIIGYVYEKESDDLNCIYEISDGKNFAYTTEEKDAYGDKGTWKPTGLSFYTKKV